MLVMLGYSYNTDNEGSSTEAKKELLALKPHLLAITSTEYKQLLIAGKAVMALGWNGDGAAVAAKKPAEYVVAEEGGEFWVDSYVIPVGAKNPDAAHAWIDYVYEPKINALETSYTYYGSPLKRRARRRAGSEDPQEHAPSSRPRRRSPSSSRTRSPRRARSSATGSGRSSRPRKLAVGTSASRSGVGAPRPRRRRRPPLPGVARAARRSAGTRRFFLVPLGDHRGLQLRGARRLRRHRLHLEPRELPLPLGPALRRGLPADARARALRHRRDARRRLPVRLLARPLRAPQDAAAVADHLRSGRAS